SGILTEMQAEQDNILYVVVGMGININQESIEEEISHRATSIRLETGKEWELVPIIQEMLTLFEEKYDDYLHHGFDNVKETWENYGFRINERLKIETSQKSWE